MAYPSDAEVEAAAAEWGIDTRAAYAYAALNEQAPSSTAAGQAVANQAQSYSVQWGGIPNGQAIILAFVAASGGWPSSLALLQSWATGAGAFVPGTSGGWTGVVPFAGQNYPPGGAAVNPPPAPTAPVTIYSANPAVTATAGASSGGLGGLFGLFQNLQGDAQTYKPELIVGGALLAAWWLGIPQKLLGHRRRY